MITEINIYPINNITEHFLEKFFNKKKVKRKSWYFLDFRSDSDQDQDSLFHKTDPRIRKHIKMKQIRNTAFHTLFGQRGRKYTVEVPYLPPKYCLSSPLLSSEP